MNTTDSIRWFKRTFGTQIAKAVSGTPFTPDLLTAIAQQETGYIWSGLVQKGLPLADILRLCVGDTIDAKYKNGKNVGRSAFPKNKEDLLSHPRGQELFDVARQSLVDMAQYVPGYGQAVANPSKFCHGFGIFQYDLQFCRANPGYFLRKEWCSFPKCLAVAIEELYSALERQGWKAKATLSFEEQIHVAIAYNRGTSVLSKGYKQGHFDGSRYYGEYIHEFLLIARSIQDSPVGGLPQNPGEVVLPPPEKPAEGGKVYTVDVASALMLRAAPDRDAAIRRKLPAGQIVTRIDGDKPARWYEIETSVNGALVRGFSYAKYLKEVPKAIIVPVVVPTAEPVSGPPAVYCPREPGSITRRTDPAGARSLNEKGQPGRTGGTAEERVAEIAEIIKWLDVANPKHKRYLPGAGRTFCNIYAHDFCTLSGVYLPRVWWTGPALVRIGMGQKVEPLIGDTIDEQRANDLFRWLKGFGTSFGWRESGSLTELQQTANLGAICLIIARRREDGKSGHVVMVVPETQSEKASRDKDGNVTRPLQSQAGSGNFSYGRGIKDWWAGDRFAEHAFWIHP